MEQANTAPTTEAFVERLFSGVVATYDVFSIYLGDRLGLYPHLTRPITARELAETTGTDERYIREWLEQQAVTGIVDATPSDGEMRFEIPPQHREVLLDTDSPNHLAALMRFTVGSLSAMPHVLRAFRTGEGVPYRDYGADAREGQADTNRTQFINFLGSEWFPKIEDLHRRLQDDPPARVADVACGTGWSTIALARTYPRIRVDGFDLDAASIDLARQNAAREGLAERVAFEVRDASEDGAGADYDLVTVFEALHDMARPVEALRAIRSMLAPGGTVIVADERTDESFAAPGDDVQRLFYAWSTFFCLPTGREDQPSAATGAVMRPDQLRSYAEAAGYRSIDVLPIENDFWRFYRLTPS